MPEFWRLADQAGLVPADASEKIEQAFQSNHPGLELTPKNVADFLVQYRRMTDFQAQCLLSSPPRPVRLGSFIIRTPETPPPLSQWIEVIRPSDQSLGFLIRTVAGNAILQQHAAVVHPSLQPIEIEEFGGAWLVYSPIAGGRALDAQTDDVSQVAICRIGRQLADALAALHEQGIVHGQMGMDRIWVMPQEGQVCLLRDCSGATEITDSWLDASVQPVIAPELNSRSPQTQASDVYALCRLLFDLMVGHGVPGSFDPQGVPEVLQNAIRQGATGNPLHRVLGYAMAVEPSQRITDAATLSQALAASAVALESQSASSVKPVAATVSPIASKTVVPAVSKAAGGNPSKGEVASTKARSDKAKTKELSDASLKSRPKSPAPAEVPASSVTEAKVASVTTASVTTVPVSAVPPAPIAQAAAPQSAPVLVIRRRPRPLAPIILAAMGLIVVAQIIYLAIVDPGPSVVVRERPKFPPISEIPSVRSTSQSLPAVPPKAQPPKAQPPNAQPPESTDDLAETTGANKFQIVEDSRLLFAPPNPDNRTIGPPQVRLMPAGASILLVMRPSTWFGEAPDTVVSAMSDEWAPWAEAFQKRSGLTWDEIDSMAAGFYSGVEGNPKVAYSIRTRQPQKIESLVSRWEAELKEQPQESAARMYRSKSSNYVVIPSADEQTSEFFIGETGQAQELIDGGDFESSEPALPSILMRLWRQLPNDADLVVVMQPNFIFADGRQMIESSLPAFSTALQRMLVPDVSAMSVSVHSSDKNYFVESRFLPAGRISEASLLNSMQQEISQWPQRAESFISSLAVDSTWARLMKRYPAMVTFATEQTRFGISRSAVTINQYLPKTATSQISVATLLAANAPPAQSQSVTEVSMTMDEILAFPISLSFVQESLKAAMAGVEDELAKSLPPGVTAPKIEIIGGDLEKNGITQNQQIRNFDMQSKPAREVLTKMVIAANPDKSAPGPTDVKQMLLWVVDTTSEPAKIRITTREAATGNFELPTEFVAK